MACEVAFWSHFGTRAMQSDLEWRDSRCCMTLCGEASLPVNEGGDESARHADQKWPQPCVLDLHSESSRQAARSAGETKFRERTGNCGKVPMSLVREKRIALGSVSCGSGWSVPSVSIQLTFSQEKSFVRHGAGLSFP